MTDAKLSSDLELARILEGFAEAVGGALGEISAGQVMIMRRLTRIERALANERKWIMSELSDALAEVTAAIDAHDSELARLLEDFGARVNGKLDANEKDQFAEIVHRLAASDALIESADPAPAATPSTASEQVPDGAQGVGTVGAGGDPTAVDSGEHIG
jgi:uncharacterized coiled-coil protein SlyX